MILEISVWRLLRIRYQTTAFSHRQPTHLVLHEFLSSKHAFPTTIPLLPSRFPYPLQFRRPLLSSAHSSATQIRMYSTSCSSTNPHNTNITPLLHLQVRQTSQRKAYSGPTVCLYTCCTAWCSRAQLQQPSPSTDRHRGCHFVTSDTRNSATYIQPFHLPQRQSRSLARPSNTSNLSNSRFLCEYVCLYDQLTPHSFHIPRRHFLLRSTAHSSNTTHSIKCPRHQP